MRNPPTPLERLDELLLSLYQMGVEDSRDAEYHDYHYKEAKQALADWCYEVLDEVLGEENLEELAGFEYDEASIRNQLRQEARGRLKEMLGVKHGDSK